MISFKVIEVQFKKNKYNIFKSWSRDMFNETKDCLNKVSLLTFHSRLKYRLLFYIGTLTTLDFNVIGDPCNIIIYTTTSSFTLPRHHPLNSVNTNLMETTTLTPFK